MQYRTLGRTGLRISEIGFGTWGMGGTMWLGAKDQESLRALHRAADLGMNFLDTALVYGEGHSEQLLGKFLKERPDQMIIATKIPPKNFQWPARTGTPLGKAFPYSHIIESTERSLKNLGVETIDLQQLHVWLDDWTDVSEWYEAVSTLKAEGKIRHCGISINDHQPANALKAVRSGKIDTVQVIYNIFDQNPEDDLFPACLANNVGVIVRCPFDEGALTGAIRPETTFPSGDWRNRYFAGTGNSRSSIAWNACAASWAPGRLRSPNLPSVSASTTRPSPPSSRACAARATSMRIAQHLTDVSFPR